METPFTEVVRGYARLASTELERWSEHASQVAARLDAGDYDTDSAARDFARTVSLATRSGLLWASEAFDAAAILSGRQYEPHLVDSVSFEAPQGARLRLAGPLVKGGGPDELPVSTVTIEPAELPPGEGSFSLTADATGYPGGTYVGTVVASIPDGEPVAVQVWIQVP